MAWRLADRTLDLARPIAAGIVNVTVDSMFEGARSGTPEQAVADGLALAEAGFEMIDVGAVAAKAGPPVPPEEEAAALVPAVEGLAGGVPVSADTFSVEVARRALAAGAVVVNDISGGSEEMFGLVAETGCGYVLMHIEGPPRVDRPWREYGDVVDHLRAWFEGRVELARDLGVAEEQIAIDPGLDFDLSPEQDLEILHNREKAWRSESDACLPWSSISMPKQGRFSSSTKFRATMPGVGCPCRTSRHSATSTHRQVALLLPCSRPNISPAISR